MVGDGWRWEGGRITDAARVWEQRGWGGPGRGKGERRVHLYLKSDPCFRGLVDRFVAVVDVSTPEEHGDASGDDNFADEEHHVRHRHQGLQMFRARAWVIDGDVWVEGMVCCRSHVTPG